MLYITTI